MIETLQAYTALLDALVARNYTFVTPTPLTHARVLARADKRQARDLRDVLGWSLPFRRADIDAEIVALLEGIGALEDAPGGLQRSIFRVSSLGGDLFLHSAFPTTQQDAVFFGPDSYRFAAFISAELPRFGKRQGVVDIGTGSGVGAIVAARIAAPETIWFNDINKRALDLAMANAWFASVDGAMLFADTDDIRTLAGPIDCIIANPPYIVDPAHRAYRDGGGMHGAEISLAWAKAAAERLARGGVFLLYTGSAIVNGEDRFKAALHEMLADFEIGYREIDPDVFGEELEREDYGDVERIAVVGAVAVKT